MEAKKPRVLLVEDEPEMLDLLAEILEEEGCAVDKTPDAEVARKVFREEHSVLVTDVDLPGESGFSLAKDLSRGDETGASLPVVLVTASSRAELRAWASEPARALVAKPFSAAAVVRAVQEVLQETDLERAERREPDRMANPRPVDDRSPKDDRPKRNFLGAATFLLGGGVLLALGLISLRPPELPVRHGSGVERSAELSLLAPSGAVASSPELFAWRAVSEAQSYRIFLERPGELVWESLSEDARLEAPASLSAQLDIGVLFRWRVEAYPTADAVGSAIARSGWQSFEIVASDQLAAEAEPDR